jgi:hypothetical protein
MLDKIIVGAGVVACWLVASIWYWRVIVGNPGNVKGSKVALVAFVVFAAAAIGWGVGGIAIGCTPAQRQDARSALELASLICGQAETVTKCLDRVVPVDSPAPEKPQAPASCPIAARDGGRD